MQHSGFPSITLRERNDLNRFWPAFLEPDRPDQSALRVASPSGQVFDVTGPALAAELHPSVLSLIKQDRGVFDTFPLSLITTQTIARPADTVGVELDVQRFRPNLLVKATSDAAFPEDDWPGCVLRIGSLRLRVDKLDGRCVVITIDPQTAQRSPAILRAVAQDRHGCQGVYGSTVTPGAVALGDVVFIDACT